MDYSNYIIKDTTTWGRYRFEYDTIEKLRIIKKAELLHPTRRYYPFIDNQYKIYAFVPKKQKESIKESQTFLVSYTYSYNDDENKEIEFINYLHELKLSFYKKNCLYQGKEAYIIIIMDTDINLEKILEYMGF